MGRLSNKDRNNIPQHTDEAEHFLKVCSRYYDEYQGKFYKFARDNGYEAEEDLYNHTLLCCYESISRNGLSDKTDQGCLNYFFKSFKMNLNIRDKYEKRLSEVGDDELVNLAEEMTSGEPTTELTVKRQLFDDYCIQHIFSLVEGEFDEVTFNVFRLKHLCEGMTYKRLSEITGVKDVKRRCVTVRKWLQANVSKNDLRKAFSERFEE